MGVARINGVRINYQVSGEGPPLLLIHGLGSSLQDWEWQVPAFAQRHRVIAADLRGYGASDRQGPFTIAQFVADQWALLERLGVERCRVLGYSMGGAVAMQMALDRPERVEKLVLSNTLPSFRTDRFGKKLLMWTRLGMMALLGPRRLSESVARKLFPRPDQAALRERVARRRAGNDRGAYVSTVMALTRWSVAERVTELKMPVLILVSEHDYFPAEDAERFRTLLPGAGYRCFPGTRHALPLEAPEDYNQAVLQFLAD